jgi:hypothetical protein
MTERKWGAISSGATFEALATTLVFFEDAKAVLFGRRGKDGGQDARSGDGTRVFQAKHHQDGSAAKAIADAKSEIAKIAKYRKPGHARHDQWKGVTHWRLVTNAAFNPTDGQRWDTEVVPLFAAQALTADFWEQANLNALLDKHVEVHRAFFENETRAFLSLPELRERLPLDEPFLRRDDLGAFVGREPEMTIVREFLASTELFLVVHGAGGVGKTRLLVEVGERIASEGTWQVLWANVASMAATGAWFDAIATERPTLLLVDEPPDAQLLQQLTEQLGGRIGRTANWKIAVAVRSPKDPVLRFLRGARVKTRVRELSINPLPSADAEKMCVDLLSTGSLSTWSVEARNEAARVLAHRFAYHPVWLTLAVHSLESHGDLSKVPHTASALADSYLDEVISAQTDAPAAQIRELLRWVALVGTVNRTDDGLMKVIGEATAIGTETEVRRRLASLIQRRAFQERGANNRLIELKPDVLRDHVLLTWLTADVGHGAAGSIVPSDDAKRLVGMVSAAMAAGDVSALGRTILTSVARAELLLRLSGTAVPLLTEFFSGVSAALSTMTASHRLALADVLVTLGPFCPSESTRLVGALRSSVVADEKIDFILGERVVGQNDVLLALAWPAFHAAIGAQDLEAQRLVLGELCSLAEAEGDLAAHLPGGLPNDGKRAAELIPRTLEGGPQFWCEFVDIGREHAERLLADLEREPPTPGKLAVLTSLVQELVTTERKREWFDDRHFHMQTYALGPGDPAWDIREALLARIRAMLETTATPLGTRTALWQVLAEAHRPRFGVARKAGAGGPPPLDAKLAELGWAKTVLSSRTNVLQEMAAARELWAWHVEFEKRTDVRAAAEELERLYAANDLASEFEPLLGRANWENREMAATQKAEALATATTPDAITAFLARARQFFGSDEGLGRLGFVAWALGTRAASHDAVRNFVADALAEVSVSARSNFASVVAASWSGDLRRGAAPVTARDCVEQLLTQCGSDHQRVNLLLQIYGHLPRPKDVGEPTPEEHQLLRSQLKLMIDNGCGPAFIGAVAVTLSYEWDSLRELLDRGIALVPPEQMPATLRRLLDGVYWAVRDGASTPPGLATWLLDHLLSLPDFDDLGGNAEWYLDEILKKAGKAPLVWLPDALARRRALESVAEGVRVRALGHSARFSRHVQHVRPEDVDVPEIRAAVGQIVDLVSDRGTIGYRLPEVLHDVDPDGLLAPAEIARRVAIASTDEELRRFARIAPAFVVGTAAWRAIAHAVVARAPANPDTRRHLFSALGERGIRTFSGTPGEVPVVFVSAVDEARSTLEAETEVELRPFWEWRLAVAQAELREEEERAKEERGE